MVNGIVIFIITYLICSLNAAIIVTKVVKHDDIRNYGSKNAGTTNVIRVLGKGYGLLVFILDLLKVLVSFGIMTMYAKIFKIQDTTFIEGSFLISSVFAHCFPIYYNFKGGKGVVTLLTSMLCIDYKIALVCIIFGVLTIAVTRMVSLGSILGSILLVIMIAVMKPIYLIPVFLVVLIVLFKHKENIKRIINKKENKLF